MRDLHRLPPDLPVPVDDGACAHLPGRTLPDIALPSTADRRVRLRDVAQTASVFFFYPRTGRPEEPAPADWDRIPGARGCTPQSCGFRERLDDFKRRGVQVFGVSAQATDYQKEFVSRNHIPYEILSDEEFLLTEALGLPTFEYDGMRLIKRLALFARASTIEKVFYPVFPPDRNAEDVLAWLTQN